jgi:hypothetical protein
MRLTADVVTGRLDVREAANHLRDRAGEHEPLDAVYDETLPDPEDGEETEEPEAVEA